MHLVRVAPCFHFRLSSAALPQNTRGLPRKRDVPSRVVLYRRVYLCVSVCGCFYTVALEVCCLLVYLNCFSKNLFAVYYLLVCIVFVCSYV